MLLAWWEQSERQGLTAGQNKCLSVFHSSSNREKGLNSALSGAEQKWMVQWDRCSSSSTSYRYKPPELKTQHHKSLLIHAARYHDNQSLWSWVSASLFYLWQTQKPFRRKLNQLSVPAEWVWLLWFVRDNGSRDNNNCDHLTACWFVCLSSLLKRRIES